jgi:hypothetical protein
VILIGARSTYQRVLEALLVCLLLATQSLSKQNAVDQNAQDSTTYNSACTQQIHEHSERCLQTQCTAAVPNNMLLSLLLLLLALLPVLMQLLQRFKNLKAEVSESPLCHQLLQTTACHHARH